MLQFVENKYRPFQSDFLVRAHMDKLQVRFRGQEVLQYLLIDGEFRGALAGHWRIGRYDIDDILLELKETESVTRKKEILDAVRKIYSPDLHVVLRYNGKVPCLNHKKMLFKYLLY